MTPQSKQCKYVYALNLLPLCTFSVSNHILMSPYDSLTNFSFKRVDVFFFVRTFLCPVNCYREQPIAAKRSCNPLQGVVVSLLTAL